MTTAVVETETNTAVESLTFTVTQGEWFDFLMDAAIGAEGPKGDLPELQQIKIVASGGILTATATDRYIVIRRTSEFQVPSGELATYISASQIKKAQAYMRATVARSSKVTVTLNAAGATVMVPLNIPSSFIIPNPDAGELPRLDKLVFERHEAVETPVVAFRQDLLKRICSFSDKTAPIRFYFKKDVTSGRQVRFEVGSNVVGIVMSARLPEGER